MSPAPLRKRRPWAVSLPVTTMEDERLSWRARGVLAGLMCKPDGWDVRADQIARGGREGRAAILSALRELRRYGYLRTSRRQLVGDEAAAAGKRSGTWLTETEVSDQPVPEWLAEVTADPARSSPPVRSTGGRFPNAGSPNAGQPNAGSCDAISSPLTQQLGLRPAVGELHSPPPPERAAAEAPREPDQANRAEARHRECSDLETRAGALVDGLPAPWSRIGPQTRRRVLPGVARALADGWAPADLAAHLAAHPDGVRQAGRVLLARLADLPAPPAVVPPDDPRDPWCGVCHEVTRMIEDPEDDYRPLPCAACHPRRARSVAS